MRRSRTAQSLVEFTAGMVVLCLMLFGLVQVFRWGMVDMVERRMDHERSFFNEALTTERQVRPDFHQVRPVDALWYTNSAKR